MVLDHGVGDAKRRWLSRAGGRTKLFVGDEWLVPRRKANATQYLSNTS
jgi:hypothetical protein